MITGRTFDIKFKVNEDSTDLNFGERLVLVASSKCDESSHYCIPRWLPRFVLICMRQSQDRYHNGGTGVHTEPAIRFLDLSARNLIMRPIQLSSRCGAAQVRPGCLLDVKAASIHIEQCIGKGDRSELHLGLGNLSRAKQARSARQIDVLRFSNRSYNSCKRGDSGGGYLLNFGTCNECREIVTWTVVLDSRHHTARGPPSWEPPQNPNL
jgi:hypothetical protein